MKRKCMAMTGGKQLVIEEGEDEEEEKEFHDRDQRAMNLTVSHKMRLFATPATSWRHS